MQGRKDDAREKGWCKGRNDDARGRWMMQGRKDDARGGRMMQVRKDDVRESGMREERRCKGGGGVKTFLWINANIKPLISISTMVTFKYKDCSVFAKKFCIDFCTLNMHCCYISMLKVLSKTSIIPIFWFNHKKIIKESLQLI